MWEQLALQTSAEVYLRLEPYCNDVVRTKALLLWAL